MKNILILTFITLCNLANAQTLTADWAFNAGDKQYFSYTIKTMEDDSGNIYNIGYYEGTVDFDPSADKFELTSDVDIDQGYVFIQKLSPNKELLWVRSLGNKNSYIGINSADMDKDGNIYLAGGYSGTLFIGSGLSAIHPHRGELDCFVAKYDRNGNLQWGKSYGSDEGENIIELKVTSGRIILIGNYEKELDLDWNAGVSKLTPIQAIETYTAVYDLNGNLQWAKALEGASSRAGAIAEDAEGNVIISGRFNDPNNSNLTSIYVYKYSGTGLFRWFKTLKTTVRFGFSDDLATRPNGDIIVLGRYAGTIDCNPRPDVSVNTTSNGSADYFVVSLDKDGDYLWNNNFGSDGLESKASLSVNSIGEIYLAGIYNGTIDFDQGVGSAIRSPSNDFALFVMKLNTQNQLQYVYSYDGKVGVNSIYNTGQTVLLGGHINSDIDFGNGVTTNYSSSDGHFLSAIFTECNLDTKLSQIGNILGTTEQGTYQWINCSNGFTPIAGATQASYTATQDGSYAVQITNGNCVDTSVCVFLSKVGVRESEQYTTTVYPNPSSGTIHIETGTPLSSITLYNAHGQEVMHIDGKELTGQSLQLPDTKGLYYLQLKSSQGTETHRVIRY